MAITLVLTIFAPFVLSEVFAESIVVEFDKNHYYLGDSLTLSGHVLDLGMPIIAVSIYDPDGKILSVNNIEISSEQTFSKSVSLDFPFYEKSGEYKVKLNYGQISQTHYFVVEGENSEPKEEIAIVEEEKENSLDTEVVLLYTDKEMYTDNDVITINGLVSSLDSPSVLIRIYDPLGAPAGFYFAEVDSNLEFSTNFLVKAGVNFRTDGMYSIKTHYAETETIYYFDFQKEILPIIADKNDLENETTENKQHEDELQKILDEIISEIDSDIELRQEQINNEDTLDNNNPVSDNLIINNSQYDNESNSNDDSIMKKIEKETLVKQQQQQKNSEIQKTKIIDEKDNPKQTVSKSETKKYTNLTVEDLMLAKLLNQTNLECDSSTFIDTISYYDKMGPALYKLCKFNNSLDSFNRSLIENPNDVEILVNKGSALGKLGYFSEAIIHYDQAITLDPAFLPAKNNKANALANLGKIDEAISLYNEILEKNPDYPTARTNLGLALSLQTTQINNPVDITPKPSFESLALEEPSSLIPSEPNVINSENQQSSNFFENVGNTFSSFGSLFNFLN
ncbi:MAG: tetratricopeptide repeat protein [Nitrosopumilus sp.]